MNKIFRNIATVALTATLLTGCDSFTDIQPKGENLLQSVDDLEMLLNYEYSGESSLDMMTVVGDVYPQMQIMNAINHPQKTIESILLTWDEAAHRKEMRDLWLSDHNYTDFYKFIGRIANPILLNIDKASGKPDQRMQIKAEALVMRAYFHYLLVNKFAAAYNPASAASTPGIPYLLETQDLLEPMSQLSLKDTYEHILADLDAALKLNALPEAAPNQMRFGLPMAYAVKAMTLLNMQRYDEAAAAATECLRLHPKVADYNEYITEERLTIFIKVLTMHRPFMSCPEDIFTFRSIIGTIGITDESWDRFEDGHVCRDRVATDIKMFGTGKGMEIIGLDAPLTYDFTPTWNNFGVRSSQMHLLLAECAIMNNDINTAMDHIDLLRSNRIIEDLYNPMKGKVKTMDEVIALFKKTAHGENVWTYYNYVDRKRWTQNPRLRETYTRTIGGKSYTLTPESPLWIFPFPQKVKELNPNIKDNY